MVLEIIGKDPQALASLLSGIFTALAIGSSAYFQNQTFKQVQNSNRNFEDTWRIRDEAHKNETKYWTSLDQLNLIRKDLRYQIYSEPHRMVSVATRILKKVDSETLKGNSVCNLDFFKKLDEEGSEYHLQINDYRSLCRDNIANLRSLMEEYAEKKPYVEGLAKKNGFDFNHKLLTIGDANRILKRFERFKSALETIDRQYPNNEDDELYNQKSFESLLQKCSGESIIRYEK